MSLAKATLKFTTELRLQSNEQSRGEKTIHIIFIGMEIVEATERASWISNINYRFSSSKKALNVLNDSSERFMRAWSASVQVTLFCVVQAHHKEAQLRQRWVLTIGHTYMHEHVLIHSQISSTALETRFLAQAGETRGGNEKKRRMQKTYIFQNNIYNFRTAMNLTSHVLMHII